MACHPGGPGSIPGAYKSSLFLAFSFEICPTNQIAAWDFWVPDVIDRGSVTKTGISSANDSACISEPRKMGKNGKPLPSAKIVSNSTRGLASNEDRLFTSLVFAFGQFLDHDLDHVPIHEASGKSLLLLKSLLFKSGNCCKPEVKICSILGKVVFTYLIEIIVYNTCKCGYYSRAVTIRKWDSLVADTFLERILHKSGY